MKKIVFRPCGLCIKCQVFLNVVASEGYSSACERACGGCINHREVEINVNDSSEEDSSDVS